MWTSLPTISLQRAEDTSASDVHEIASRASFSTTVDIYGHLMVNAHREAAKKMDKLFTKPKPPSRE